MRNRFSLRLILAAALLSAAGCAQKAELAPARSAASGEAPSKSFSQISGIPIPSGASMEVDKTHIFGGGENWFGALAISAGASPADIFDFYMSEMARFGWQEVTTMRGPINVMTFQKSDRVATILIQRTTLGGSAIDFKVSPQGPAGSGSGLGYGAGQAGSQGGRDTGVSSSPLAPPRR